MKTNKTKQILIGCLSMAMVTATGCSKDNPLNPLGDCGSGGWASKVSKELNDWSVAASNYSADPTPANCSSYKNAAKGYLNALDDVRGCVLGANQANFNKAINEAKVEFDSLDCSGS